MGITTLIAAATYDYFGELDFTYRTVMYITVLLLADFVIWKYGNHEV